MLLIEKKYKNNINNVFHTIKNCYKNAIRIPLFLFCDAKQRLAQATRIERSYAELRFFLVIKKKAEKKGKQPLGD
jgi:hypothetical protein